MRETAEDSLDNMIKYSRAIAVLKGNALIKNYQKEDKNYA